MEVGRIGGRSVARRVTALAVAGAVLAALPPLLAHAAAVPQVAFIGGLAGGKPAVMLASLHGGTRVLGPGDDALLSPDGSGVAADRPSGRNGHYEVVLYSTTSRSVRLLTRASGSPANLLAWSPDGRYLAVAEFDRFVVVDVRNGHTRTITSGQVNIASFARDGTDRLVFDHSGLNSTRVDLLVVRASGGGIVALTRDGASEYPLCGPAGIFFTRVTPRGKHGPLFELWSMRADGTHARQLTHVTAPRLTDGLTAVAVSADGRHLLANFVGTDLTEAWAIDLSGPVALPRDLTAHGSGTIAAGLSRDGNLVLADRGYAGDTPAHWSLETIPWSGGRPTVLAAHGAFPSWDD
jgi:hypothetical protein